MKIVAFNGSSKKDGNSATITKELLKVAESKGHEIKDVFISDYNIKDCLGCYECNKINDTKCIQEDDMHIMIKFILESDIIIFSSPVFFGQISGRLKCFLDRWCVFFDEEFLESKTKGKKFISITTSAAPTEQYVSIVNYLKHWMVEFCGMVNIENIHIGDVTNPGDVNNHSLVLEEARSLGLSL